MAQRINQEVIFLLNLGNELENTAYLKPLGHIKTILRHIFLVLSTYTKNIINTRWTQWVVSIYLFDYILLH